MPDLAVNSTETLRLTEHAVHDVHRRDYLTLDLSEDFQIFDNLTTAVYRREGVREMNDLGVVSPAYVTEYHIADALRREVFDRDLELKPAMAKISDCKVEVPKEQLPITPKQGDTIELHGASYQVMGYEHSTFATRWRLWVRGVV